MFPSWQKFKGWVVLEFFLSHPNEKIHLQELARRLGIGPSTAKAYLDEYSSRGALSSSRFANSRVFQLDESSPLVLELRKATVLAELREKKVVEKILQENPQTASIVLYGSRASGRHDEKSDYDFLVFSNDDKIPKKAFEGLGAEANVTVTSLAGWRRTSKDFKESVKRNNIVLYGTEAVRLV